MGDDPERMDAGAVVVAKPVRRALARGRLARSRLPLPRAAHAAAARGALGRAAQQLRAAGARRGARRRRPDDAARGADHRHRHQAAAPPDARPSRRCRSAASPKALAVAPGSPLPAPTRDEFGQLTSGLRDAARHLPAPVERAAPHRPLPARRRQQPLARPALAADGDGRLPRDARRPLGRRRRARARIAAWSRSRCATRATPRAWCSRSAIWPSSTSPSSACAPRRSTPASCSTTSRALRRARGAPGRRAAHRADPAATARAGRCAELDVELFERAIANLVDNALKFCPRGSTVTLAAARRDGRVEVSVADDGPGIPAADLPQLFDRFYQSRSSVAPATAEGGRGLGLAIVKRIAELHGGDVAVDERARPRHARSSSPSRRRRRAPTTPAARPRTGKARCRAACGR